MRDTLERVKDGKLEPPEAELIISKAGTAAATTPEETLEAFANLDHGRARRTGFPEAVFAAGKTAYQVATILDDFARDLNESIARDPSDRFSESNGRAILATRSVLVVVAM